MPHHEPEMGDHMPGLPHTTAPPAGIGATALGVALLRARESRRNDRLFHDPWAQAFVDRGDPGFSLWKRQDSGPDLLELMAGQVAVRTRFLDQALLDAARQGAVQVVLLGCGMDSRAFRLEWPAGTTVYEADQPDVLAFKSTVLHQRQARPRCHRVEIPVDLRTDWPTTLINSGFQAEKPTAWLAEGILYALPPDGADVFLDRITTCSYPGSTLALDHNEDSALLRSVLAAISPDLAAFWQGGPSSDLHTWLAQHGWHADVVHDIADIAAAYHRPTPPAFDPNNNQAGRGWLATARHSADR